MSVGGIAINTPNYKSASYFRSLPNTDNCYKQGSILHVNSFYPYNIHTTYTVTSFGKAFAHVQNCLLKKKKHMAQTKTLTDSTQKGGFSKLCVKIKKRCYTDLLHFSTPKHNLVSFFSRIVF
jgi:hypothetical protein